MQGSGLLAVDGAMLVCDNDAKLGAIDPGDDIGAC
jgi:hypothetical protein